MTAPNRRLPGGARELANRAGTVAHPRATLGDTYNGATLRLVLDAEGLMSSALTAHGTGLDGSLHLDPDLEKAPGCQCQDESHPSGCHRVADGVLRLTCPCAGHNPSWLFCSPCRDKFLTAWDELVRMDLVLACRHCGRPAQREWLSWIPL